jgi:tRNA pseudouridine32 synthase/23S rRNA pseudouridine746 synthase/23S rRNA pseudouridine1911/1915/1917 synthase
MAKKKQSVNRHLPQGLTILYEDKDILVVDKPAGMLTVATATNKTRTAYHALTNYVRKGAAKSRNRLFVVHRLDQWTSGVLLFAKSEEMKFRLQAGWKEVKKTYAAIIHGQLAKKEGVISSYLAENTEYVVYSTTKTIVQPLAADKSEARIPKSETNSNYQKTEFSKQTATSYNSPKGKLAHTAYKVLKENQRYSLLEIDLLTGKKNQIRVHLADEGHPIVGDCKYGRKHDGHKRLALHAKSISFQHPATGKQMTFEAKTPTYFDKLIQI